MGRAATVLLALSLLTGCPEKRVRRAEPPRPPTPPPADAVAGDVAPEHVLAVVGGRATWAELVDPARGVVFAEWWSDASGEDTRADADGVVKIAEHLCGAALDARLQRLRDDLARRVEADGGEPPLRCEAGVCRFSAQGEYDTDGRLAFVRGGPSGRALASVVEIEGGPVTEEFVARGEAWVAAQLARLAGARCPEP